MCLLFCSACTSSGALLVIPSLTDAESSLQGLLTAGGGIPPDLATESTDFLTEFPSPLAVSSPVSSAFRPPILLFQLLLALSWSFSVCVLSSASVTATFRPSSDLAGLPNPR